MGSLPSMSGHHLLPKQRGLGRAGSLCITVSTAAPSGPKPQRKHAQEASGAGGGGWGEAPGKFGCSLGGHRAPVSWLTGVMIAD